MSPSAILNSPDWIRTVEPLYRVQQFTGAPLAAAIGTPAAAPILPGQVVNLVNGEIVLADQGVDGGSFFGLMFSEYSSTIDETEGKTIDPVVLLGPGTVYVWNTVVTTPPALATAPGAVVELVAVAGHLKVRGAETGPTVATLNQVLSDRIEIQLREAQTLVP